jgi:hypothetical protein
MRYSSSQSLRLIRICAEGDTGASYWMSDIPVRFPEDGRTYADAFFLFMDASGHSRIVAAHHQDKASAAFDMVQETIAKRVTSLAKEERCEVAFLWGWQGDGGLWLLWDSKNPTNAHNAALAVGQVLLAHDLPLLKGEFNRMKIEGQLHLRIAIHRGSFRGRDYADRGSIHSEDINFAAHLEKVTPRDTLAISGEVFRKSNDETKKKFSYVGDHEDQKVFLWSPVLNQRQLGKRWVERTGAGAPELHAFPRRPDPGEKASLIKLCEKSFFDVGTTLRTCAESLTTNQGGDPYYRDAVIELLDRGLEVRCYMLDPNGKVATSFQPDPSEDTKSIAAESLRRLTKFKKERDGKKGKFEVYTYDVDPGFAAMAFDLDAPDGLLFYAPFLTTFPGAKEVPRKLMPHYLLSRASQADLYNRIQHQITAVTNLAKQADHRAILTKLVNPSSIAAPNPTKATQVTVKCAFCKRTGKKYPATGANRPCDVCHGKGTVTLLSEARLMKCGPCDGSGRAYPLTGASDLCTTCKGLGRIPQFGEIKILR